ncbi:SsrA-binding protein SmpB [Candidatus Uhrbacteria bacterium]|nr:SsrA-binding protein SmpB [Candidatus Uhrbacteria bacterium]
MKSVAPTRYAENRKARFEYEVLETFQGGLVLQGQEVKSIRTGGAKLDGSYLAISRGELWLIGAHIRKYAKTNNTEDYDPNQNRKVLVHKKELAYLGEKIQEKGLTLVPFSLYPSGNRIKVSFSVCRGRKTHDKREMLKNRDLERELQRNL